MFYAQNLESKTRELEQYQVEAASQRSHYSVSTLTADVIRMETGLPTKEIFYIIVEISFILYALRFKESINYFYTLKVTKVSFEDHIFITLMKLRQNYTSLYLAQLFSCSVATISNILITFIHVLNDILFKEIMTTIPSRHKSSTCIPSSFSSSGSSTCKIVIDCTYIEVATPGLISHQNATHSSYRGMNTFKVLVGVAPNAVITFVSQLYPGSISDKEIVQRSGFLNQLSTCFHGSSPYY